ncbi:hypothetical protein ACFWBF_17520 [Streptomyces sp. NPDC060028]|uniref:hypothetical protein n=1 Tax=Streptomyces sp. NPDC060028 TaxID=3347041 RepID=UPI0036AD3F59
MHWSDLTQAAGGLLALVSALVELTTVITTRRNAGAATGTTPPERGAGDEAQEPDA